MAGGRPKSRFLPDALRAPEAEVVSGTATVAEVWDERLTGGRGQIAARQKDDRLVEVPSGPCPRPPILLFNLFAPLPVHTMQREHCRSRLVATLPSIALRN